MTEPGISLAGTPYEGAPDGPWTWVEGYGAWWLSPASAERHRDSGRPRASDAILDSPMLDGGHDGPIGRLLAAAPKLAAEVRDLRAQLRAEREMWSSENAAQATRLASMEAALREIEKGEGRFSRDHLTHCENTVEDMKAIARRALLPASPTGEADSLAAQAGIDTFVCEFCDRRVKPDEPHIVGLDGMRAHKLCVEAYPND